MELDGFTQSLNDLIFFHLIFIAMLPLVYCLNLIALFKKNYATINKNLWRNMVIIYFLLSVIFLGGLSIWAMQHFHFSFKVCLMILLFCFILGGEIYRNKRLKTARIAKSSMEQYIAFCKKFYFASLIFTLGMLFGARLL